MAYLLDSTQIRAPHEFTEENSTQMAVQRTLNGNINRDYFGSNKRIWTLNYQNAQKSQYDAIKAIYDSYLATGATKTWAITETNYTVSSTRVHVDLLQRGFSIRGSDYLSDFTLTLTEA